MGSRPVLGRPDIHECYMQCPYNYSLEAVQEGFGVG
jgi:hypothetical protein